VFSQKFVALKKLFDFKKFVIKLKLNKNAIKKSNIKEDSRFVIKLLLITIAIKFIFNLFSSKIKVKKRNCQD